MRAIILVVICLCSLNVLSAKNDIIEYREINDKTDVFYFLFAKHSILLNPDCHRRVFEGRAAKVYVAMGCSIQKLVLDKSDREESMAAVHATYKCQEKMIQYTAHCELK